MPAATNTKKPNRAVMCYVPDETLMGIEMFAVKSRGSRAAVIRRALAEWLEQQNALV